MKLSVSFQRIALILLCFLFSLTELMAAVVSESSASKIAGDFVFWNSGSRAGSGTLRLAHVVKSGGADRIYIYNVDGGGWVMVSGDDNTRRQVLGYSPTGRFDYSAMPINARSWIESYADVISRLESHPEYIRRDSVMQSRASGSVAPLLGEISWGQGEPFNLLCPTLSNGERAVTGCVATAMAQIMMYYKYAEGQESISYEWNGQTLSVDFGKYDWDLMAPKYTGNESEASRQAVATLMRDCGYSVKADYGEETGAYFPNIPGALLGYFVYDHSLIYLPHSDCDTEAWENIIRKDLDSGHPVLYQGIGNVGGHAFVCDGYDDKGYFHFNWGWSGANDGYYLTGEHSFPYDQAIIYGIQPACGGSLKGYFVIEKLRTVEDGLGFAGSFSYSYHGNTTIEIGYGIENVETGEKRTYSLNEFGGLTGDRLEKTFMPEVSDLEDGNYIVYPLMRCEGETEWSNCFYKESKFPSGEKKNWEVEVKDGECVYPTVSRTIDGITYGEEYLNAGIYVVDVIDISDDKENLVIPSKVTIGGETYKVNRAFINEKENLLSLTTDISYVSVYSCPNFKTLNHNGATLWGGCDSPVLEDIILTEALTDYSFYITNNGGTLKEIKFPIKRQGLQLNGQALSNLGIMDIYLYSDIPPVFGNKDLLENTDITFHIPAGTKDIYSNAGFDKIGTLIEETTASSYNVEWGLNGGIYQNGEGFGLGAGSNNVEFAVKLNRNAAETYKGNKITAITFFIGEDSNVEYVFLSKDDKGYITRKYVDALPGAVKTVYFDKPYTITGEPIYFGIGNRHSMIINWATTEYEVSDNMYIRLVGDDYGHCRIKPGKWEYRGGPDMDPEGEFGLEYPLPISVTIEGETLPVDASILSINVEGADKISESGSRNADGAQTQSGKQVGDNGLFRYTRTADGIGEIEFADDRTFSSGEQATVNNNSVEDKIPEVKLFDDQCTVTVRVQNRSDKKIHSLKLKTTAGGKEFITEYPKTLAVNQTALIPVSFPIKDLADEFTVNTSIAEVEGNIDNIPDDGNTSARVMNYSRSETYPLKAVVEKATSATKYDRYEPSQKKLEEELPDNFIVIDIHYDDEMAKPENYDPIDSWKNTDLPLIYSNRLTSVVMEDRYIKEGPYGLETTVKFEKKKNKATESVKITKAVTNGEECEVSAVVSTAYHAEGKSFALAFVVVEDQVGPYPKQCNTGKVDDNNQWILETRDELFDNVARGIYGEFNGMTGLLPEKMATNASYPVRYSFTMPKNIQNLDNTKIVALLLDDSQMRWWEEYSVIANADRMKLEVDRNMSGVDEVTEDADDIIKVEGNRIYTTVSCERFEVITIDGKRTVSENLAKGFYVARAVVNGRTYVKKVVI